MKFLHLMLCLLFSFSSFAQHSDSIKSKNKAGYLACEKTIFSYPELRDNGPSKAYGELFTKDSTFEVKKFNIFLEGRKEISERLEKALETTKTVHTITRTKIDLITNNTYKSRSDFTLNLQKFPEEQFKAIYITGYYDDLLQFDGKRCEIVYRKVIIQSQQP